jgi:adenylate kinase
MWMADHVLIIVYFVFVFTGKGTQGKLLSAKLGVPHVSTGELFRAEVASGSAIGREMDNYMRAGVIIPPPLTFDYLEIEFAKPAYKNGFILDGYPKNRECLDWLLKACPKWNHEVSHAIELFVPRDEAERRLLERLHCSACNKDVAKSQGLTSCPTCKQKLAPRSDDVPETIRARLNVYETSTNELMKKYREMGILISIDGSRSIEQVFSDIMNTLTPSGVKSYYVRDPAPGKERSARFHNHLDAHDHALLLRMTRQIQFRVPSSQNKVYPIEYLKLGPQTQDSKFADVYRSLPNFHSISDAKDEAFMTGKMGDEDFDYDHIRATLEVAFSHSGAGVMTEIEQDLFEMEIDQKENVSERVWKNMIDLDWKQIGEEWRSKQIAHVPAFELHHGFDIPKSVSSKLPISLDSLMEQTTRAGLNLGGWFVFAKPDVWSYRCNEFADEGTVQSLIAKVVQQAKDLRVIVWICSFPN